MENDLLMEMPYGNHQRQEVTTCISTSMHLVSKFYYGGVRVRLRQHGMENVPSFLDCKRLVLDTVPT